MTQSYVGLDRWGNRWAGTQYWQVRVDLAKRVLVHWVKEPGVYEGTIRTGPPPVHEKIIRASTRGIPVRVWHRPDLDGHYVSTHDDQPVTQFEREDGQLVYADPKFVKPCLGRLPDLPLFQFDRPGATACLGAIVANHKGQPAALLMPIRPRGIVHNAIARAA